jgi:homocysteine S-methyltransferase
VVTLVAMGEQLRTRLATGPPVLLDGGLATTLEDLGVPLPRPLWSAHALLEAPQAVTSAHRAFVQAGAEVLLTATYQLSGPGLRRAGLEPGRLAPLAARAVRLARDATRGAGRRVWVAGSLGPHGAVRADGSEYTGAYDLSPTALRDRHAPRVAALLEAGVDAVAVETVPAGAEVAALASLLAGSGVPAWVSVTVAGDGTRTPRGEPLAEALAPAAEVDEVVAVGVNCCPPELVPPALAALSGLRRRAVTLLAAPNAGRRWDPAFQAWRAGDGRADAGAWVEQGAGIVGGCCGTGPADLAALATSLRGRTPS